MYSTTKTTTDSGHLEPTLKPCFCLLFWKPLAYSLSHIWLFVTPWTVACQALLSMGILQARLLEWVAMESSQPRNQTRSPTLQVDLLPSEPPGKPKNTGVGILSLLQGIFSTQESNQGLLHCRWILYQLSCQRSPRIKIQHTKTYRRLQNQCSEGNL